VFVRLQLVILNLLAYLAIYVYFQRTFFEEGLHMKGAVSEVHQIAG
jgi:hypothetical protein